MQIPLSGRLMAVADVYNVLICKRVYKPGFSHDGARAILLEGKGTHFDPLLIEVFCDCEQEFRAMHRDSVPELEAGAAAS